MSSSVDSERVKRASWLYRFMLRAWVPFVRTVWVRTRVEGLEHIPATGPAIMISNHVDNNDTYLIGSFVPWTIHFLARSEGIHSRVLGRFWRAMEAIPADREGLSRALALLKVGEGIGVFPDGVITPHMVQAKAGVAVLAVRSGAPVLPVAVWGTEKVRIWPLPRGRRRVVHVRFGPIRTVPRAAVRKKGLQELTDELMVDVAAMLPPEYRGFYAGAVEERARSAPVAAGLEQARLAAGDDRRTAGAAASVSGTAGRGGKEPPLMLGTDSMETA